MPEPRLSERLLALEPQLSAALLALVPEPLVRRPWSWVVQRAPLSEPQWQAEPWLELPTLATQQMGWLGQPKSQEQRGQVQSHQLQAEPGHPYQPTRPRSPEPPHSSG